MKITLSTNGIVGINVINKLFSLGRKPQDIDVWYSDVSPLIDFCKDRNIPTTKITSPEHFKNISVNSDLLLSIVGTPLLVPDSVIEQFRFGGINLHPADTEKYRGRWMVSWCLINNESCVAYTWHRMNNRYDTGNILIKQEFEMQPHDTALSLNAKIFDHAISNLDQVLEMTTQSGRAPSQLGKYYNKDMPFGGVIDTNWTLPQVDRFVRAMYHPPYQPARLLLDNKEYLIETIDDYVAHNHCITKETMLK